MNLDEHDKKVLKFLAVVVFGLFLLAVIGILMGILGNLPMPNPPAPNEVIIKSLNEIKGLNAETIPVKAYFTKGMTYEIQEVIQYDVNIFASEVNFAHTPKVLSLIDNPTTNSFTVTRKFDGIVVACSDQSREVKYIIAIGTKGEEKEVMQACREALNSN